jgi:hypothetical protein
MARLAELASRLDLRDDEALAIFRVDALEAISGDVEHRPEIDILDALTSEAAELVGDVSLARWVHSTAVTPTPLTLLERGDWGAFEHALAGWLRDSGVDGPA